jgi:uncharacterized protein (DUF2252 family)
LRAGIGDDGRVTTSAKQQRAHGRAARRQVPRSSHAQWRPPADRPDPVGVLEDQARTRVAGLVPIRYARMIVSPFSFYRGAAAIMAADLAKTPATGSIVQLCGDAHLANFGTFESPERDLVFDVNDFDETLPGPWEWDVKRLAASVCVAGREREFDQRQITAAVTGTVAAYREAVNAFAAEGNLAVWYSHLDVAGLLRSIRRQGIDRARLGQLERSLRQAHRNTGLHALAKLTETTDGTVRFISQPPLLVPVDELLSPDDRQEAEDSLKGLLHRYGASLSDDRRRLFQSYRFVTMARKVVGVGSVGMRAWVVLLVGRDEHDPLLLQCKEAVASVLEPHAGRSTYADHGRRVVEGQRLVQASSDIFLGWNQTTSGGGMGDGRDYYVRQLADGKGGVDVSVLSPTGLTAYGRLCGRTLARAHARSGNRLAISGYLGKAESFDRAVAAFAELYADQNERDYRALVEAVRVGRVPAAPDPGPGPASGPGSGSGLGSVLGSGTG